MLLFMTMYKCGQHRRQQGAVVQSLTWLVADRPAWSKLDIHKFPSSLPMLDEASVKHKAVVGTLNFIQYVRNLTFTATKSLHNFLSKGVILSLSSSQLAGTLALLFPVNSEFVIGNFSCTFTNSRRMMIQNKLMSEDDSSPLCLWWLKSTNNPSTQHKFSRKFLTV